MQAAGGQQVGPRPRGDGRRRVAATAAFDAQQPQRRRVHGPRLGAQHAQQGPAPVRRARVARGRTRPHATVGRQAAGGAQPGRPGGHEGGQGGVPGGGGGRGGRGPAATATLHAEAGLAADEQADRVERGQGGQGGPIQRARRGGDRAGAARPHRSRFRPGAVGAQQGDRLVHPADGRRPGDGRPVGRVGVGGGRREQAGERGAQGGVILGAWLTPTTQRARVRAQPGRGRLADRAVRAGAAQEEQACPVPGGVLGPGGRDRVRVVRGVVIVATAAAVRGHGHLGRDVGRVRAHPVRPVRAGGGACVKSE